MQFLIADIGVAQDRQVTASQMEAAVMLCTCRRNTAALQIRLLVLNQCRRPCRRQRSCS